MQPQNLPSFGTLAPPAADLIGDNLPLPGVPLAAEPLGDWADEFPTQVSFRNWGVSDNALDLPPFDQDANDPFDMSLADGTTVPQTPLSTGSVCEPRQRIIQPLHRHASGRSSHSTMDTLLAMGTAADATMRSCVLPSSACFQQGMLPACDASSTRLQPMVMPYQLSSQPSMPNIAANCNATANVCQLEHAFKADLAGQPAATEWHSDSPTSSAAKQAPEAAPHTTRASRAAARQQRTCENAGSDYSQEDQVNRRERKRRNAVVYRARKRMQTEQLQSELSSAKDRVTSLEAQMDRLVLENARLVKLLESAHALLAQHSQNGLRQ